MSHCVLSFLSLPMRHCVLSLLSLSTHPAPAEHPGTLAADCVCVCVVMCLNCRMVSFTRLVLCIECKAQIDRKPSQPAMPVHVSIATYNTLSTQTPTPAQYEDPGIGQARYFYS